MSCRLLRPMAARRDWNPEAGAQLTQAPSGETEFVCECFDRGRPDAVVELLSGKRDPRHFPRLHDARSNGTCSAAILATAKPTRDHGIVAATCLNAAACGANASRREEESGAVR